MISITQNKKKRKIRFWAVAFWLLVWQVASMAIGQEILLVSPVAVLQRLGELIWKKEFWASVGFSLSRIAGGFLLGMGFGVLLGGISAGFDRIKELFAPLVLTMKSIPVASFVILALIWIPSENLSVFISFFMVFPVVYTNVQQGMERVDQNLLEMAQVFQVTGIRRIRYIYLSQVLPFSAPAVLWHWDFAGRQGWRQKLSEYQKVLLESICTSQKCIWKLQIYLPGQ